MISQKKLTSTASIFYMTAFKNTLIWSDLSVIHKVSTYLVRKLMIMCSNAFLQDWEHFIKQIIKKINKFKNNTMSEKILMTWKLLSNNILIITNTAEIKKQLKCSKCWLSTINQIIKVNCCKFTVLMHEICMSVFNCSKQNTVIKKLLNQNQYFWDRIKFLHVC